MPPGGRQRNLPQGLKTPRSLSTKFSRVPRRLSEMSNCYCRPGKAGAKRGGTPRIIRALLTTGRASPRPLRIRFRPFEAGIADVLAAIQTMAIYSKYRRSAEEWARLISGHKTNAAHWKELFDDHREFFRPPEAYPGNYALVWRRAADDQFHTGLKKELSPAEIDLLPEKEQRRYLTRPPVPEAHIKTLVDAAITLHQTAVDQYRDRRWWIAPVIGLIATTVGAFIGAIAGAHFK